MIHLLRSRFTGLGHDGDFLWMLEQPTYARTLFVFNDNEGEFYAHLRGGPHVCSAGGGNAAIRPWQCQAQPRAAGVPTGTYAAGPHHGGYAFLDGQVTRAISDAMLRISSLLATGRFDTLAFSWDERTKLGGNIFCTAQPVRDLIVQRLVEVAAQS